jgi:hypothetical protein
MLDWWLFPALLVFMGIIWALYVVMKHHGGTGVRTEGRTLVDNRDSRSSSFPASFVVLLNEWKAFGDQAGP